MYGLPKPSAFIEAKTQQMRSIASTKRGTTRSESIEVLATTNPEELAEYVHAQSKCVPIKPTGDPTEVSQDGYERFEVRVRIENNDTAKFLDKWHRQGAASYGMVSARPTTDAYRFKVQAEQHNPSAYIAAIVNEETAQVLIDAESQIKKYISDFNELLLNSEAQLTAAAQQIATDVIQKSKSELERRRGLEAKTGFKFIRQP